MAYTLSETSESNNLTHASSCSVDKTLCNHLKYFKEFLRDLSTDAVSYDSSRNSLNLSCNDHNGGAELRPFILTRSNNESYAVNKDELPAEIIMCIWQWLVQKQCPKHFHLGVLLKVDQEIKNQLKNKKIQEDLKTTSVQQIDEKTDIITLDLLKLQKFIHIELEKYLSHLSDNSNEQNLKNFADCCRQDQIGCTVPVLNDYRQYVEAHIKNKPRKMEDRHICLPNFSYIYNIEESLSFYGIFDGHSGSLAATYVTNQIPYLVAQHIKSAYNSSSDNHDIYRDALEASFLQADYNFCQKQVGSGTTAVCVLLVKDNQQNFKHMYAAWVGDSKCLLVTPTVHLQLVKPHKPDLPDERKRIESAETGGSVLFVQGQWRVNGIINVSRSIGDYTVKAVIAEPDIVDVPLQTSHDFLVLASDGLWDHVDESAIIDGIYKTVVDNEQCLDDIPKHLIELAKQGDSQDNITVVIVWLKERQKIIENFLNLKKSS